MGICRVTALLAATCIFETQWLEIYQGFNRVGT